MKNFIFLSDEGSTYQPKSSSLEPDVENLQVVGFGQGDTAPSALQDLIDKNAYLRETNFDEVWALEVSRGSGQHLSLRDAR